ncbi:MAG: SDR family NAD(P)-dependent oxidoreductase [Polyangiaceae bacterium]
MQKALITGASSGIGLALARKLAADGVAVWLAARRSDLLEEAVSSLRAGGHDAHALTLDVADHAATERAVAALDDAIGGIDLLVANAGIGSAPVPAAKLTFERAKHTIDVNLLGALATILPVVPRMVARGRGHVVGVSSLAADVPLPAAVDYGVSKAALTFFLESLGADVRSKGVAVTAIHPGFVRTAITDKNTFDMPFLMSAERAADIIARGIRRRARVVRFPLPMTIATLGSRVMPGALRDALVNANRPKTSFDD